MTSVYRETSNKILNYREGNRRYWDFMIREGKYSESEVLETLEQIEVINDLWQKLLEKAFDCLEDSDGVMNSVYGYATDTHRRLDEAIQKVSYVIPYDKDNGQGGWPVRKWQKELKQTERRIEKVRKLFEQVKGETGCKGKS